MILVTILILVGLSIGLFFFAGWLEKSHDARMAESDDLGVAGSFEKVSDEEMEEFFADLELAEDNEESPDSKE